MVKLVTTVVTDIPVHQLKDGQLATITAWSNQTYIGRVVQRFGDDLITIGRDSDHGWHGFFPETANNDVCRVRRLVDGDSLVVTNE